LIEQGLTSHQTHYRLYWRRFLQVIWPNQQCQSTEWNREKSGNFKIRLTRPIIYALFSQFLSASGRFAPRPPPGLPPNTAG